MFSGEESIRIKSARSGEDLEPIIERAMDHLGRVYFERRGEFEIDTRQFQNALATTEITGWLSKGRKEGEWRLTVTYQVNPSALCWVIVVLGALFFLAGVLILLAPHSTKGEVQRAVVRALRDARDDVEDEEVG